jgi:ribose transport system ATP-binding protein
METAIVSDKQEMRGQSWPPVIKLSHISKTFGGVHALNDVNLTIERGEIHGLVGENGSGKSTLIKILAGYHAPDHHGGQLFVNGQPVKLPLHPGQFRQLGMSFVHQDLGLVPPLTVLENLRIGDLSAPGGWYISWGRERERAQKVFEEFGVQIDPMAKVADLRPTDRARLAIVRALEEIRSANCGEKIGWGLLILDEPTVYLPAAGKRQLYDLMRDITSRGASVLFVSHHLDEVREITHRVTVLRNGYVQGTVVTAETTDDQVISMIIGRQLDALVVQRSDLQKKPADIAITGLSGGLLRNIRIGIHKGEVLGLTGLAGFGFEEVPYFVFGARKPQSGSLDIDGQQYDLRTMNPSHAVKAGISLLPADRQNDGSVGSLTVAENIMLQVLDRYFVGLRLRWPKIKTDAHTLLDKYDVRPKEPNLVYNALSGGNQQKVLFAKWLQTKPKLLFLHEPTQGVDIGARQEIFRVMRQAVGPETAVVCVSTDYEVLAIVCDRVIVFGRGNTLRELVGDNITKDRIVEQCYALAG